MSQSYTQFQVQSLKMTNTQRVMEAVMVMFLALFTTAMLPQLLMQYVYTNTAMMVQPPKLVELTPVICYGLSVLYVIFVVVTNMQRGKKIKQLEQDLYFSSGATGASMNDSMDESDDAELKELEKMVDEAMSSKGGSKTARKAGSKTRRK